MAIRLICDSLPCQRVILERSASDPLPAVPLASWKLVTPDGRSFHLCDSCGEELLRAVTGERKLTEAPRW